MRIHFVVNPNAGRFCHQRQTADIRREFAGHDILISPRPPAMPQNKPFHLEDLFKSASEPKDPDIVVAVGGDGTVNRVVNAVAQRSIPVGIIPCGSSNDLARALGIPRNFRKACQIVKTAQLMDIDLVSVNGRYFGTCGGFGIAGRVAERANRWRQDRGRFFQMTRFLGRMVYPLALVREICGGWQPPQARIDTGESSLEDTWFSVLISNQPGCGGFTLSPGANNRDGLADICQMRAPASRLRWLWISLQTYLGRADTCPEVSRSHLRKVNIASQDPISFFGDGEILDWGYFFRVRVQPRALWVVSPNGHRTWRWWEQNREKKEKKVRDYFRRQSCRLTTISAPAAVTALRDSSGCPSIRSDVVPAVGSEPGGFWEREPV